MVASVPQWQPASWEWPTCNDRIPVNLDAYYLSAYPKQGLSLVKAARQIDDTYEAWLNRKHAPIAYLVKFGQHAIAERLYYRLARALDLPQQHVFWGVFPGYDNLVAVAIQFEADAFFPKKVDGVAGIVTYRRRTIPLLNAQDHLRHRVLHTFCGSADGNQAMVKGTVLFGIDAADCTPHAQDVAFWRWFTDWFRTHQPAALPILLEMMHTIAQRPDLPDLAVQELRESPYPIVRDEGPAHYGSALRATHDALQEALAGNQAI